MDPDMVRQQAEAEREALALLQAKPAIPATAKTAPVWRAVEAAAQDTAPVPLQAAAPKHAPAAPAAVLADGHAPALQVARRRRSVAVRFGQFISYGLAGAVLGGGLGIVAANYFEFPAELAKLAIFGPAGFFAAVCAIASIFTKAPGQ